MNISPISLSGMNAAQTLMQTSAHNIANLDTPNFTRQQTTQNTAAGGGVSTNIVPGGSTNLETDMVQQLQAKNSYLANLSVFKRNNETLGTLLNISA